ncbi:MAG: hypothetical protein ABSF38_05550 [Verrucomicrobiota bacterium]
MKIQTINIVTAATLFLVGCGKQNGSSGTASSPAKEPSSAASAATAANITGTWKWIAPTNPDGKTPDITFTLKLQGATLTGTVNKSTSTEVITNGVGQGDEVSFQTVVQKKAGPTTTTYSGKISGDTIKGKVEVEVGDRKLGTQDWEADRTKE